MRRQCRDKKENDAIPVWRRKPMTKVLFVCMGNICRSPTAEGVFRKLLQKHRLEGDFVVKSAGTHGYHVGEPPDSRTQRAAVARGYDLSGIRAAKVTEKDLACYDLVLAMDKINLDNLLRLLPEQRGKMRLFMEFARNYEDDEVPDPFYGLGYGFDVVIDMVEDAALGLLDFLLAERAKHALPHSAHSAATAAAETNGVFGANGLFSGTSEKVAEANGAHPETDGQSLNAHGTALEANGKLPEANGTLGTPATAATVATPSPATRKKKSQAPRQTARNAREKGNRTH
jgi:protein-tyrosine phosphatase